MIKVIVFNTDAEFGSALRNQLHASREARIVAEITDPDELISTTVRLAPDVVIIYLHPEPDPILTLASRLNQTCQKARIFAIADSDDPQLILTSMRAGMCEFLTKPIDASELNLALSKVAALKPPDAGKGKILAMMGSTGGCGSTFLAVNMACELVCTCEQSAVVVDLDFCGGQVATYLDLTPSFTLGDLIENAETLDHQMLDRILTRHSSQVAVIARPTPLVQGRLLQTPQAGKLITEVISTLVDMFDYVILDGLNPTDPNHLNLLSMADHVLLVMNLLVPSIRNADRLLQAIQQQGLTVENSTTNFANAPADSILGTLLLAINRLGRDSGYLRVQDVEQTLHRKTLAQIPDDWRTVSRSINAGEPLYLYAPNSKIRSSIVELAERLVDNDPAGSNQAWSRKASQNHKSTHSTSKRASLFGRMLKRSVALTHTSNRDRSARKSPPRSLAAVVPKGPSKS